MLRGIARLGRSISTVSFRGATFRAQPSPDQTYIDFFTQPKAPDPDEYKMLQAVESPPGLAITTELANRAQDARTALERYLNATHHIAQIGETESGPVVRAFRKQTQTWDEFKRECYLAAGINPATANLPCLPKPR